ncbi:MAG: amidohydrolase family protein [Acidimicrobiia bacterium]
MVLDTDNRPSDQALDATTRYLVISSDCHAGAEMGTYREYLESRYLDEFDEWAKIYVNPFDDLKGPDFDRNFNSERRITELEADGCVAEVLFPNTIPPFFPSGNLVAPQPSAQEYEQRWAGLKAHNRWMADFCREAPGRRAGIAQIMLNDVDDALAEIRWAKDAGLTGGILLPGAPPGAPVPQLHAPDYEPIWATCAELDVVVNHHGAGASPTGLIAGHTGGAIFLIEQGWYSHRALWHLIYSGVFERHPSLKFVLTEQGGSSWIPGLLDFLDFYYERFGEPDTVEGHFGGDAVKGMSLTPREYWARNCYVGASFMRKIEGPLRHEIGLDHIMYGVDYPHTESTYPYTREALRWTLADAPADEMHKMLGLTAAEVYGFDVDALRPIADRVGPTVGELHVPLDAPPPDSRSLGFTMETFNRPW